MNPSNTEHSSIENSDASEIMPENQTNIIANIQEEIVTQEETAHPRSIQTFMKRRTHMNKQAEMALTDPHFAKYLVNIHIEDSSDESKKIIDSSKKDVNHLTNNEKKHRFAKIENIPDDVSGINDLRALFSGSPNGANAPLTLEIGFGMGDSLIEMAIAEPNRNFVGIEVHEPGIGRCAYMAFENGLENLKIINGDAIKLMKQLPENHIDRIQLYFPDPWQKKRHYKRRFVSPERMAIVTCVLNKGGWFHSATDWEHYSQWMLEVLDGFEGLSNISGTGNFTPRPDFRPATKFEKRGIDRGHGIWDLIYSKDD